jgi:hypothetical protein
MQLLLRLFGAVRRRLLDATTGVGHPVTVTAHVWEGLDAVWLSGETDMADTRAVQILAFRMGYPHTTWWLEFFPNLYIAGLTHGFVVETPPVCE